MNRYSSLSDDYYVNMNLNTEMELPQSRETVLHFFEQIQKHYPGMRNFYNRERGEFVLEEDKDQGTYRWATVETDYSDLGDLDGAFQWVERAIEERDTLVAFVHIYTPLLAPELATDPRYDTLLARLNLSDVAR